MYVFISLQLTENGRLLIFSRKMFLAKNPWDCQIRSNQTVASTEYNEPFPFLINRKNVKQQISKITTKDTSLYVATTSQICQSHLGASCYTLGRLKLFIFVYVLVRRRKDVSNRSLLLTYQLRRRDDASAWSRTF